MRSGLEFFLRTPTCFEIRDEYLIYYGRSSPYIFRTPTPFTADQLQVIGRNGAQLVAERTGARSAHVIGLASRGIPLATAITIELSTVHNLDAVLSTVSRDGSVDHLSVERSDYTILVDNALVSGRTMELVLGRVQEAGIKVDLVIYLFDREEVDSAGSEAASRVAVRFGCEVVSIFSLRDIIEALGNSVHQKVLLEYAKRFGTQSLREYIKAGK
jgi:orotate phosphoribosyltransferase